MSTVTRKAGRPMIDPGPDAMLGQRIRARRTSLMMTQMGLAAAAGLSTVRSTGANIISDLELGKNLPSYRSIEGLCKALQWTPNVLFAWPEGDAAS